MVQLYFNPSKFPRTISRKEWKEIWRWKRVVQKQLVIELERMQEQLILYGTTILPQAKADIIEKMVNPPLLIHDKQSI